MLKSLAFAAAIGAMGAFRPTVIEGGLSRADATDVVIDLTPMASSPPVPKSVPLPAAMRAFLAEVQEWGEGNEFRLQHIAGWYEQLRHAHGWPEVSSKKLSQQLVALGCKRAQLDLRASGKGRLTALRLPLRRVA